MKVELLARWWVEVLFWLAAAGTTIVIMDLAQMSPAPWLSLLVPLGVILLRGDSFGRRTHELRRVGGRWELWKRRWYPGARFRLLAADAAVEVERRWRLTWAVVDGRRWRIDADDARRILVASNPVPSAVYHPPIGARPSRPPLGNGPG